MDSDLLGAEIPGAILDYVKEDKKEETMKDKETNIKEIKKKIFETFQNAKKEIVEDDDNDYYGSKLIQMLKYDDSITQEIYETVRLSDPSKVNVFYAKLSTKKESDYIGYIIEVKTKGNYEPNQFIIKLGNNIEVIYDKKLIRKSEDKKKKIEKIVEYFEKAKNNKILHINLGLKENYIGNKIEREPYIIDYSEWDVWNKYKNIIIEKKEKYRLTFYEYQMGSMLGLNIFDLEGHEKELLDLLYIPRFLGLYKIKTSILPGDLVPFTHIIQFTPPATGKTQFALSMKNYFNIDYYDKFPSRPKLVFHAQDEVPGAIYKHDYIIIDEFTKKSIDEIKGFIDIINTGLSSGEWVVEKGSDKNRGFYKPIGFIIFGNSLGYEEISAFSKSDKYDVVIDYKEFDDMREAIKHILYKGTKKHDNISAVNSFVDRFAIPSIVLETLNISKMGVLNLAPNPLELYALRDLIQERINIIAKEPNKYIDIEKIDREKWKDGRMRDNTIKIAIKLIAMEIDKYLNRSAEDLAIEMVKGLWAWNPK